MVVARAGTHNLHPYSLGCNHIHLVAAAVVVATLATTFRASILKMFVEIYTYLEQHHRHRRRTDSSCLTSY